jgi:FAD/FMN-containing dehydrogenase
LIGSEGTLAVITAAWLRLVPAPELALPVLASYADVAAGCAAVQRVLANGLAVAALEYMDARTLALCARDFPFALGDDAPGFMVLAEADGSASEARALAAELARVLGEDATALHAPTDRREIGALWRWRERTSLVVAAAHGGKLSEDIVVPLDRLAEAITATLEIGAAHGLDACSWGHAGDGNLHSTLLFAPGEAGALERADAAAEDLFALAVRLGGSISGEHGIGYAKRGQLARQWAPGALALHAQIKRAFDPKNLLNPGKKLAGGAR